MIKNKTLIGVIGVIILIFGITFTIPVAINRLFYLLPLTALAVIVGLLLIAWAFGQ